MVFKDLTGKLIPDAPGGPLIGFKCVQQVSAGTLVISCDLMDLMDIMKYKLE